MGRKLLYLIGSTDPGGAETVLVDLARGFASRGDDVTVGHLGNDWLEEELARHGIESVRLGFSRYFHSHLTQWFFAVLLFRFIRRGGFDLIHAHLFGMILCSSVAGLFARRPVVGTIHDKYYFSEKRHRRWAYRVFRSLGCRLVGVSHDIIRELIPGSGLSEDDVLCIHNGTDLGAFDAALDRSRKRAQFGFGDDEIVVTSVGRLVKIKGHSSAIRAGREIVRKNPRIRFLLVGEGPEEANLKKQVADLGLIDHVVFAGHRDDVSELLKMSDIFLQTSLSEGLSCTVVEALAAGCPAIVTDVGGNREIVTDGAEGYVVELGDDSAIEARVLALAEDQELRAALSNKAWETARAAFSMGKMLDNYERLYEELLERGARGVA